MRFVELNGKFSSLSRDKLMAGGDNINEDAAQYRVLAQSLLRLIRMATQKLSPVCNTACRPVPVVIERSKGLSTLSEKSLPGETRDALLNSASAFAHWAEHSQMADGGLLIFGASLS